MYSHVGVFFPKVIGTAGLMPYVSTTLSWYERLDHRLSDLYAIGCSLLLDGIRSRLSFEVQNRPTWGIDIETDPYGQLATGVRRSQVVMQYQVVW